MCHTKSFIHVTLHEFGNYCFPLDSRQLTLGETLNTIANAPNLHNLQSSAILEQVLPLGRCSLLGCTNAVASQCAWTSEMTFVLISSLL